MNEGESANFALKLVTMATSLERVEKGGQICYLLSNIYRSVKTLRKSVQ